MTDLPTSETVLSALRSAAQEMDGWRTLDEIAASVEYAERPERPDAQHVQNLVTGLVGDGRVESRERQRASAVYRAAD